MITTGLKLFEALKKDPEYQASLSERIELARRNPFYQRVMKEALISDMAGALGRMHDVVIEAAKPALIGREMIWVMPTTEALVRFPKAKLATAYETGELAQVWFTGEKYETQDIKADTEIKAGGEWSRRFVEDASWPVLERQTEEIGRSIGELETAEVIKLYEGVADVDLAGGAVQSPATAGTFAWADLVKLWNVIKDENFNANCLVLHPDQVADLWKDDKFIHSFYFGELVDVQRGVLGQSYLGLKIVSSTKCTAGTVLAIDTTVAAVLLVRRDLITEPFENPKEDRYGVVASERIGLGVLRTKAVAKMTGA